MRIPDPKANTTAEAYLAYKAGFLEESELKPSLYEPYLHFDAWLAYWAGLTDTYPTDENGDPEMLCDEEALVAYLSGVTNTYPEEIKDPYDVRIVGYLKYLVSARWGKPEYPVNNEEFYLSTMKPPVVPSGDTPSADIELDDTAEAPFIDLKMYGDTFQQTYSGKNLLRYTLASLKTANTVGTWSDNQYSYYGITYTVNNDLTISLTGTATGGASYLILNDSLSLENGVEYILSGSPSGGSPQLYSTRLYKTSSYDSDVGSGLTFNYDGQNLVRINVFEGAAANVLFKPMIEQGSTVSMYEPYVGGAPAPNPDYPQNVNVVTGEQTVTVTGKNLFDGLMENGGFLSNGLNGSGRQRIRCVNYIPVQPNTEYTIKVHGWDTSKGAVCGVSISFYDTNDYTTPRLSYIDWENGGNGLTFTTPLGCSYIRFILSIGSSVIGTSNIVYTDVSNIQLEQGPATAYEPYQDQSYEVNLGKNLNSQGIRNGLYQISNGRYANTYDYVTTQDLLPIGYGDTITISTQSGLSGNFYILEYDSNKSYLNVNNVKRNVTSATFTISNANTKYIAVDFATTSATATTVGGIQVEAGSSATSYAPYFTPIELCKIDTHQDYIYKSGGNWYVHKEFASITFNGSETGWNNDSSGGYFRTLHDLPGVANAGPNRVIVSTISNYFTPSTQNAYGVCFRNNTNIYFYPQSSITTLADFKTWLGTHNTLVYYPLATPTDTQITNTDLISQLDALMEGGSYEGKTYIKVTATDPNLPGLLYVEAGKYD